MVINVNNWRSTLETLSLNTKIFVRGQEVSIPHLILPTSTKARIIQVVKYI